MEERDPSEISAFSALHGDPRPFPGSGPWGSGGGLPPARKIDLHYWMIALGLGLTMWLLFLAII